VSVVSVGPRTCHLSCAMRDVPRMELGVKGSDHGVKGFHSGSGKDASDMAMVLRVLGVG